jgi:hypothetical protein
MGKDLMRPDFYWIPTVVAENSMPHEAFVFAVVYWFANLKDGVCYASNERIAQALPFPSTPNSVGNALLDLERCGFVLRVFADEARRNRTEIKCLVGIERVQPTNGTGSTHRLNVIHPLVGYVPPTGGQISNSDKKDRLTTTEGFDKFWKAYPRRVAKPDAIKAWKRLSLTAVDVDKVLAGLDEWKGSDQWERDNGRYVPHPATFLNQRRWEDEVPKKEVGFISFNK